MVRFVARDVIATSTLSWTWGLKSITLGGVEAWFDNGRDSLFCDVGDSSVGDVAMARIGLDSSEDRYVGFSAFLLSLYEVSDFAFG